MDRLSHYLYFLITMADGLIFLHANHHPRCDAVVDKYFEGYCTLQFALRGTVEIYYDEKQYRLEAPVFWTCFPGPHIRFHGFRGKTWNHRYVSFRGADLVTLRQHGLFFEGVQACPPSEAPRYAALLDRMIRLIHTSGPLAPLRVANLFESLLLDLASWRRERGIAEPWLEKTMDLLESGSLQAPDYAGLARKIGMGLSTLRRRFRQAAGQPLHHYVLERRMVEARRLAATTNLPFKKVAEELGYENVFYFSRQFRRFHGVPPLVYRRSRQTLNSR
jgi:AraC-like DNA-binding protein